MTVTRRGYALMGLWVLMIGAAWLPAAAQTAADSGALAAPAATGLTWKQMIQYGGWLMYVLSVLSVMTVALVIYFSVVLRMRHVAPSFWHRDIVEKIRAGAIDDARHACEFRNCPLSAIVLSAINYLREVPDADATMLQDIVEGEGSRQAEVIQGQVQYLMDIGAIAPMVGLLGTVFGMLQAFGSVALDIAKAQPIVLAAGVSQALITTAYGLIIGIPAMAFYAFFRRRASRLVAQLETATSEVLALLVRQRSA